MKNRLLSILFVVFTLHYVANAFLSASSTSQHVNSAPHQNRIDNDRPTENHYLSGIPSETFGPIDFTDAKNNRLVRDAHNTAQFLNHTTIVAHIANGIYLQSGLMDGSIPIDALVGEFLNFGTVKVSDVANFKPDKVSALTNKLKEIRDSVNSENKWDELESKASKWNTWYNTYKSIEKVNFKTVPESKEYLIDVKQLLNKLKFDTLQSTVQIPLELFDELEDLEENSSGATLKMSEDKLLGVFRSVKTRLTTLVPNFVSLRKNLEALLSDRSLKGSQIFAPHLKVIKLMIDRDNLTLLRDTSIFQKNIKNVLEPIADAKSASQHVSTLKELTKRRVSPHPSSVQYTDGFPNSLTDLKQLVKDVRDPWLTDILGLGDKLKINGLSDGLQPLFKTAETLGQLSAKLEPIFTVTFHESLMKFSDLNNQISALSPDSANDADVLKKYYDCHKNINLTPESSFRNVRDFVKNVNSFEDGIGVIMKAVQNLDTTKLKQKVDGLLKLIPFSDNDTNSEAKQKLGSVIKGFKNSDKLADIKIEIGRLKDQFSLVNTTYLNETAFKLDSNAGNIPGTTFIYGVEQEYKVFVCLKKLSTKSVPVHSAIRVVHDMRKMSTKDIENVEFVTSTVSQLLKDLSDVKSIPETMKGEAKDVSTSLNKMPDSQKTSKSIGQTVRSLQYAYTLKDLEPSISALRNAETVIRSEIDKVSDPEKRKVIVQQWGDHGKHMIELEDSLAKIKSFDSKLDVSKAKNMGEYGASLKDLATLSDTKINANDKVKALETLIPSATDPKVKSELKAARKTIETISTLDLDFSSHKSQFQSAPGAFNSLYEFLPQFLKTEYENAARLEEEGDKTWMYILIGVSLLAAVAFSAGTPFLIKHKSSRTIASREKTWNKTYTFLDYNAAIGVFVRMYQAYVAANGNVIRGPFRFRHDNVEWEMDAAQMDVRKLKFFATNTPTEENVETFCRMLIHVGANDMVVPDINVGAFCSLVEGQTVTHGLFQVKTVKIERANNIETMQVAVTFNQDTHTIRVHRLMGWDGGAVPRDHHDQVQLLQSLRKKQQPGVAIWVLASDNERPIAFIGLEYGPHAVRKGRSLKHIIERLGKSRSDAFNSPESIYRFQTGITCAFNANNPGGQDDYTHQNNMRDAGPTTPNPAP